MSARLGKLTCALGYAVAAALASNIALAAGNDIRGRLNHSVTHLVSQSTVDIR